MVKRAKAGELKTAVRAAASLLVLCAGAGLAAPGEPVALSLEQVASRRLPDFVPVYEGQTVAVKGQVSGYPVRLLDYSHVGIQDGAHGLILEGTLDAFDDLSPGSWIALEGRVSKRGGMPVVIPTSITVLSRAAPPTPRAVSPADLQGFRRLGQLVTVEARVAGLGENAGGSFLLLGPRASPLTVFLPLSPGSPRQHLGGFEVGDQVRVTGLASQYCPVPPHNDLFQLLLRDAADAVRTRRAALIEPWLVATAVGFLMAAVAVGWVRERKTRAQRARLQKIYALGEEILSAASPADALERLAGVLPYQFGVSRVRLYVYSRGTKGLEEVVARTGGPAASIALESPSGLVQRAAGACFRNKMLLSIPDSRHSPFWKPEDCQGPPPPRCMLFLPLFAQGEVEGVLQIDDDRRAREFRPDDQVVMQHLANQAGLALKLFEQRSMREQLFRSEKQAAVGQLISGVVNELQAPLAAIGASARGLATRDSVPGIETELQAIATEAARAAGIVSRLVSFVRSGPGAAATLELNELLKRLNEFREREWKARGIQVRCLAPREPVLVSGSLGQLEQAFLNLLVHAEQTLAESPVKEITIGLKELAGRALVEIAYSAAGGADETSDPFGPSSDGSGLAVCRSVIVAQGGSIRLTRPQDSWACFEVELPAQERKRDPGPRPARAGWSDLTALSIEADGCAQRRMVELLSARELRVVPVASAAEGLDLMQRLRFDVVFWGVDRPGPDYLDVLRRVQERAGLLALIAQTRQALPPVEGCRLLIKPIEEDQLELVLALAGDAKAAATARR